MNRVDVVKMTKGERLNYSFGVDALMMIEEELLNEHWSANSCPSGWHDICTRRGQRDPKRTKVTIRLDADVVKFFKGIGQGYQERINLVLRAFMHMRLAKVIDGPDTSDLVLRPEEILDRVRSRRTEWGDHQLWDEDRARFVHQEKLRQEAQYRNAEPWPTKPDPYGSEY